MNKTGYIVIGVLVLLLGGVFLLTGGDDSNRSGDDIENGTNKNSNRSSEILLGGKCVGNSGHGYEEIFFGGYRNVVDVDPNWMDATNFYGFAVRTNNIESEAFSLNQKQSLDDVLGITYLWGDGFDKGVGMSATDLTYGVTGVGVPGEIGMTITEANYMMKTFQKIFSSAFTCSDWNIESSMLDVPSHIRFMTQSELMAEQGN